MDNKLLKEKKREGSLGIIPSNLQRNWELNSWLRWTTEAEKAEYPRHSLGCDRGN